MESFNQVHIISSCVPSWGRVQWCCCCCWSVLRGWWALWLHPLQRPLPPSRELPLSLSLSPVGGQEAQTTPFIWQNDNHWQWGLSYLTQGRLQRHFVLLRPAVGQTRLCNFKERRTKWGSVRERCGYWMGQAEHRRIKAAGPLHFLIKHRRHWLQCVSEGIDISKQMILKKMLDMHQLTGHHWRFPTISWFFIAPPRTVISFYNQRMQIGICWQPINHILVAICWAAWHMPVDISCSQFALRQPNISLCHMYMRHINNIQFSTTLKGEQAARHTCHSLFLQSHRTALLHLDVLFWPAQSIYELNLAHNQSDNMISPHLNPILVVYFT